MKIILDKDEKISFEYTTLHTGKIVLDISDKQVGNIMWSIYQEVGAYGILNCFDFDELFDFKLECEEALLKTGKAF